VFPSDLRVTFDTTITIPRENGHLIPSRRLTSSRKYWSVSRALPIYLRGAMMSFVSGYYGPGSRQHRTVHGHSKLHFTRHGISQIHERRTVSRTVVKLPWNFDRNYPPPLCAPARYFPAVLFRSLHVNPRFIPMKLSTLSRDIRFRREHRGCILNPYSAGNFRVAFKRPFYYGYTSWDVHYVWHCRHYVLRRLDRDRLRDYSRAMK